MLKEIAIVTIIVGNLGALEEAYREYLGYEPAGRGEISAELAGLWDAPAMQGKPYLLLEPASGAPVYLRFVEDEPAEAYAPMTSWGWNATEILVSDPDAIERSMADSPFEVIGPSKDLWDAPNAPRAMQALGPGNEVLYLTRNDQLADAFGLAGQDFGVDRTFIMVVGGPSMDDLRSFYAETLGAPSDAASPFRITVISKALGLPTETTYPLTVARLAPGYLIELDEYPAAAGPRPVSVGHLPPGVAMVTFRATLEDAAALAWRSAPRPVAEFPYAGRRTGVIVGPAGEWIELVAD